MLILNAFFYTIAFFAIISGLIVILAKNPMTSILALVFTFINVAILFVVLHAEFIAMVMLIIYVGAISVLFVFIIMLLNIKSAIKRKLMSKNLFFGLILATAVFVEVFIIIKGNLYNIPNIKNMKFNNDLNNAYKLALDLYNNHYSLIIILGIILTIVVIGIVCVCYEETGINIYKQKMGLQTQRNPKSSVRTIKVEREKGIE